MSSRKTVGNLETSMNLADLHQHMKPEHVQVFLRAAKLHSVVILVRRTNPESVKYIGRVGYVPKPIDCKAKTAQSDVTINGKKKKTAGLVVNPELQGFSSAFASARKLADAKKCWKDLEPNVSKLVYDARGAPTNTYLEPKVSGVYDAYGAPTSWDLKSKKRFFVQMDPDHEHFGCVMISVSGLVSDGAYIHGDYDLYGIVPVDDPKKNVIIQERLHDKPHNRGLKFSQVQLSVNRGLRLAEGRPVPMILHGSQEKFANAHSNEAVDAFWPYGGVMTLRNKRDLDWLYKHAFSGRPVGVREIQIHV